MELIAVFAEQNASNVVKATQPHLTTMITDSHLDDVPAGRALRFTGLTKMMRGSHTDRYSGFS